MDVNALLSGNYNPKDWKKYTELYSNGNQIIINQVNSYVQYNNKQEAFEELGLDDIDLKNIANSDEIKSFWQDATDWFKDFFNTSSDLSNINNNENNNPDEQNAQDGVQEFKTAFDIFNDYDTEIGSDVLELVIPKLVAQLQKDTILDIEKFVDSIDLTQAASYNNYTAETLVKVFKNIAGSYGISATNELSASDFAAFTVVSNIMNKCNLNGNDTRKELSKVLSDTILMGNGYVASMTVKLNDILGNSNSTQYAMGLLKNISNLNTSGSQGKIERKDMWEFGLTTLKNYASRIDAVKNFDETNADEQTRENFSRRLNILNSELQNGGVIKNYKEQLGNNGKVSKNDFYEINTGKFIYTEKYGYDENGVKQYTEKYNTDDDLESVKLTKVGSYSAPLTSKANSTVTVSDFNDNLIAQYNYNENGKINDGYVLNSDNTKTDISYTFDNDNLKEIEKVTVDNKKKITTIDTTYYDNEGSITERIVSKTDTNRAGTYTLYDKDGNVTSKAISEYAKAKNTLTTTLYSDDSVTPVSKNILFLDKTGNEIKSELYYPVNGKFSDNIADTVTIYSAGFIYIPPQKAKPNHVINVYNSEDEKIAEYSYDENVDLMNN